MPINTRSKLILITLIIFGAILRFWNIGFQRTNVDENFTISIAGSSATIFQIVYNSLTTDYTPPLFYLASHFSMLVFGDTPTAIRIPSAIFGVLLIPALYYVGREYRDDLFGLLMAGFTVIFYNAFFYSRYGRSYAMILFFFTLAFYFFMRVLKGDKYAGIWFGIFAVLSMWTHLYSSIPLAIMGGYLLWKYKSVDAIIVMVVGALPLAYYYIPLVLHTRTQEVYNVLLLAPNTFGATPAEVVYLTPLDIFAYSAFIIFPIVLWSLWQYRNEEIIRVIALVSFATWISMFILSFKTPIIVHYAMPLVMMLLIPFILPFWKAISTKSLQYHHYVIVMVICLLEAVQIVALYTIQRGSW